MQDWMVAACFNACFADAYQTRLYGGAAEPIYLPSMIADGAQTVSDRFSGEARLYYREDFAASALHEAAHWCIAGPHRRTLVDFGYLYKPPPRTPADQEKFFRSEVRVQCLEALFAQAAGVKFSPSADNLQADLAVFISQLADARSDVTHGMRHSSDPRARTFYDCLAAQGFATGVASPALLGGESG